MQVKVAQENNILDITRFLIDEFHGSYIDTFPKVDFDKTLLYVCRHVIEGVVFFIEKDHKIIGVIAGIEAEYWYSKEKFISEGFFFVHPDHRKSRIAFKLIQELKKYAKNLDLRLICGVSSGDDVERKDRFFEFNGLNRIGGIYIC
jgi:GNAT superfamily N-acetyltransferase|tara:strand:- start:20748 stop:21185 length:438 start_codon:yes stop_codon:yes gene_type:complete